jgi:putative flippase GtrA
MTIDDFPGTDGVVTPPAGMAGEPGPLLRLIRNQRIAFLAVGVVNTVVGAAWFVLFQQLVQADFGYLTVLLCAHVAAVLCAFVLYRRFVFRVTGRVWRDLGRFEMVNLSALGFNLVTLPLLVELAHLPVLLSQLIITGATMLISFFGHRGFSFRRTPQDRRSDPARLPR